MAGEVVNSHYSLAGRRVLFISYNGMLDPLGQSQVLPYLRALSQLGVVFTLLSFERASALAAAGNAKVESLRQQLAAEGIEWHWLRYHQTPSLPATMFDVANGVRVARRLVPKNRIELVHARSHIAATIALALKRQLGVKMLFDVRGLMADEYVDAGHWKKDTTPYRLTKNVERRALAAADGVVTLTEAIWPILKTSDGLKERADLVHEVVPCCADLNLFQFSEADRKRRRAELGLGDQITFVYSGSIDGWYLTEEMADFFKTALTRDANTHALWLTPTRHERVRELMKARAVPEDRFSIVAAQSVDVPSYLSASDAGIAFIKPCFSKLASSPTKYAEYLACGLPLVINSSIGDSDSLITNEHTGVLIKDFNAQEYERALQSISEFASKREETRRLTREVAERLFDVRRTGLERYARMYESILST